MRQEVHNTDNRLGEEADKAFSDTLGEASGTVFLDTLHRHGLDVSPEVLRDHAALLTATPSKALVILLAKAVAPTATP